MTTLFNLFCPLVLSLNISYSVLFLVLLTVMILLLLLPKVLESQPFNNTYALSEGLFPLVGVSLSIYFSLFLLLSGLNLISMVSFSYPVTTTLSFNLSIAFSFWLLSIFLLLLKTNSSSFLVPSNAPWYLIMFLSLVEMVSVIVRPITLCFRLLANMSAGHILLSLISKLPACSWLAGSLFGLLELMVAVVQSFVFLMLISVYYEEAMSHSTFSFWNVTLKSLKSYN